MPVEFGATSRDSSPDFAGPGDVLAVEPRTRERISWSGGVGNMTTSEEAVGLEGGATRNQGELPGRILLTLGMFGGPFDVTATPAKRHGPVPRALGLGWRR